MIAIQSNPRYVWRMLERHIAKMRTELDERELEEVMRLQDEILVRIPHRFSKVEMARFIVGFVQQRDYLSSLVEK